jgi:hypothetical protein
MRNERGDKGGARCIAGKEVSVINLLTLVIPFVILVS